MKGMMVHNWIMVKRNGLSLLMMTGFVCVILLLNNFKNGWFESLYSCLNFLMVFLSLMVCSLISMDRRNTGLNQLFLCPINRNDYVLSKYFLVYGIDILLLVVSMITLVLSNECNGETMMISMFMSLISPLIAAFQIPVYLKFSVEKAGYVTMVLFMIIFFGGMLLYRGLTTINLFDQLGFSQLIAQPILLLGSLSMITLVINVVSIMISMHLIQSIED